ncbi:Zn-ribbon-containing, possibly RNA-binding protein and truncated derivatives [Jannaschia donghaensis]|uniref:Zn-ribbon-containing, possibly RNA-binding protein and truncated derivatives n=1 Tax=Jannaschia donghaensis TaxID=420998 RepID=A0A0M6YJA6_9RHOB|nr:DciA family protein [Jannaschia donghaensis]CTQ49357.1 Zn-ribbon-containing, possibly RNA-binding protein and truncated derivatives [Jannaschia donghaensis]
MPPTRFRKNARRVSSLVERDIKRMGEKRGFSETRLLTHWAEIAGPDTAGICRPVKIGFPRGGFGAVLTLLTTGAQAPMLQMRLPQIIDRVNACYGYRAISRVDITQTAPTGFAEGQVDFAPKAKVRAEPGPQAIAEAREKTADVGDDGLRQSLERLAANIISKQRAHGSKTENTQ